MKQSCVSHPQLIFARMLVLVHNLLVFGLQVIPDFHKSSVLYTDKCSMLYTWPTQLTSAHSHFILEWIVHLSILRNKRTACFFFQLSELASVTFFNLWVCSLFQQQTSSECRCCTMQTNTFPNTAGVGSDVIYRQQNVAYGNDCTTLLQRDCSCTTVICKVCQLLRGGGRFAQPSAKATGDSEAA